VTADPDTVRRRSFFYEEMRERLFPDFPHDMVMIEFAVKSGTLCNSVSAGC